jgi:nitrate/nitrite-specific signal transduction histidine kinase
MMLANRNSTEHLADIEHIQQVYQAQIVPLRQQLLNPALEKPSIDAITAAYAKVLSEFNQKTSGIFADLQQLDAEQQQQVISDIRLDVMTTIITLLLMGYVLFVIRRQALNPLEQLRTLLNTTVDSIITINDNVYNISISRNK